jgi:hypothetical protein
MYGFGTIHGTSIFVQGNAHYPFGSANATGQIYSGSVAVRTAPDMSLSGYTILPAAEVENTLVASAGARPADRDPQDQRIIDSIATMSGSWLASIADVGGYTPMAQNYRAFNVPANPNGDDDGNGYTNIEELLYQYALQVEGR